MSLPLSSTVDYSETVSDRVKSIRESEAAAIARRLEIVVDPDAYADGRYIATSEKLANGDTKGEGFRFGNNEADAIIVTARTMREQGMVK